VTTPPSEFDPAAAVRDALVAVRRQLVMSPFDVQGTNRGIQLRDAAGLLGEIEIPPVPDVRLDWDDAQALAESVAGWVQDTISDVIGEPWPYREEAGDVMPRAHVVLSADELSLRYGDSRRPCVAPLRRSS
jgi:hypothetical protein